ncbi:alpha/beta hydrolase fold protein [Rhizobium sp. CCGE 510]|nr:alpha/beta hydrolase fold protein [Rhizobium sp. CCGE 510]
MPVKEKLEISFEALIGKSLSSVSEKPDPVVLAVSTQIWSKAITKMKLISMNMSKNRLAILPDLTHCQTFGSPLMANVATTFLDGGGTAPDCAKQVGR